MPLFTIFLLFISWILTKSFFHDRNDLFWPSGHTYFHTLKQTKLHSPFITLLTLIQHLMPWGCYMADTTVFFKRCTKKGSYHTHLHTIQQSNPFLFFPLSTLTQHILAWCHIAIVPTFPFGDCVVGTLPVGTLMEAHIFLIVNKRICHSEFDDVAHEKALNDKYSQTVMKSDSPCEQINTWEKEQWCY